MALSRAGRFMFLLLDNQHSSMNQKELKMFEKMWFDELIVLDLFRYNMSFCDANLPANPNQFFSILSLSICVNVSGFGNNESTNYISYTIWRTGMNWLNCWLFSWAYSERCSQLWFIRFVHKGNHHFNILFCVKSWTIFTSFGLLHTLLLLCSNY